MNAKTKSGEKPMSKEVQTTGGMSLAALQSTAKTQSGFENVGVKDVAIPFLMLIQTLSPVADKRKPEYIKGAEEGDMINSVTREVFKGNEGVKFIPCGFTKKYLEWKPRDQGGLVMIHDDDRLMPTCHRVDKVGMVLPNGNTLVETAQHYGLIVGENGSLLRIVITMSSTSLKKSKNWLAQMQAIQLKGEDGKMFIPPMFAYSYRLKSIQETKGNNAWANWLISEPTPVDAEQFEAALTFAKAINEGSVKTVAPVDETVHGSGADVI